MVVRQRARFNYRFTKARKSNAITTHCHTGTGRCFWMGRGNAFWDDARAACQQDGGDLAVMETEELYNFVKDTFTFSSRVYIGLQDRDQESDFRWLNGAPLYYQRFAHYEPNDGTCVQTNGVGVWHDAACNNLWSYLCSSLAPSCTDLKAGCLNFSMAFMGRVRGPFGPSNWITAKEDCESKGLRLMTIDSREEEDYVNNTLKPSNRIILGVNDLDVETVWRNTEGLIINWATYDTNQPDGTTGHGVGIQDCMQRQTTGLMDDTECNLGRHYYCEAPEMYVNGDEVMSTVLIDDDSDTCITLDGSYGCGVDKIAMRSSWVDRVVTIEAITFHMACSDVTVAWKADWTSANGDYKICGMGREEMVPPGKYNCTYTCDVTGRATMEMKMLTKVAIDNTSKICDIKVY